MSFNNNNGATSGSINISKFNVSSSQVKPVPLKGSNLVPQKNLGLNAPMIGRVYKAKPGCSACGKKIS